MRLEDAILIDCPAAPLYRLISQLEKHVELLPGYLESRVLSRQGDTCVLQRKAMIHGKLRQWKSEVRFEPERALHFVQIEGPFTGMQVLWDLEPVGDKTRLRIIHDVRI